MFGAPDPETGTCSSPQWDAIDVDIRCPSCDYNLRGLREPRCPECGYSFTWPRLLDARLRVHPFLFEQHPRRNFWSFWMTVAGGLRHRRFWGQLSPLAPGSLGRLILYWQITNLFGIFSAAILPMTVSLVQAFASPRVNTGFYVSPLNWVSRHGTVLGLFLPSVRYLDARSMAIAYAFVVCCWPPATALALMIFRQTISRSMIVKGQHVLRCVIYSADCTIVAAVPCALLMTGYMLAMAWSRAFDPVESYLLIMVAWIGLFVYRMIVACRKYLRIDRPILTVLSTQAILTLVAVTILFYL